MPKILSNADLASMQQPLAKDGYSNESFDKLYGHKTKNPFKGTERDRGRKGKTMGFNDLYAENFERIFGKK